MSCCCALPVGVRLFTRAGSATARACVVGADEDGFYRTGQDTHTCDNGTFTVTTSIAAKIIVNGDGECETVSVESTRDPEFDYGETVSVTTAYSDKVDLSAVLAAARGGVVYGDESDQGRLDFLRGAPWFENASGLAGPSSSATEGEECGVTASQVRFELEMYAALGVSLVLQFRRASDGVLVSQQTVHLTAAAPSSGWVSAPDAPAGDAIETAWVAVRVPPYTPLEPPLP